MKGSALLVASLLILLFLVPYSTVSARRIGRPSSNHGHRHTTRPKVKVEQVVAKPNFYWERRLPTRAGRADTVQIAGSSLPDCSHACGSCSPCRLVMVSFVCASVQEAETCPMTYKCMCKNKSYPVP
ncbi:protein EPIDERMAL PATTERNING FACTOR 1 [Syzygium oleosum]|uniref:protein EPIDERMAL PATTERNING FACTOR 1 n=1 Tax=Syzygium oleosum TaxID=219896 RepID=UPI0011D1D053|nr:protein EPIDERMAL PATTERNING FACTOR 1 [Syzygium oleosum]